MPIIRSSLAASALAIGVLSAPVAHADTVWLGSLDMSKVRTTNGVRPSVDKTFEGAPLSINKKAYEHGVCVEGYTIFYVTNVSGGMDRFSAVFGVDDATPPNAASAAGVTNNAGRGGGGRGGGGAQGPRSMSVRILGDEARVLFETNSIAQGADGVPVDIDVKGVKLLAIIINNGGNAGGRGGRGGGGGGVRRFFDMAEAKIECSGPKPLMAEIAGEARERLTPMPEAAPNINGPALTGVTPGRPVLYKIPVSGVRPITYEADRLPAGLKLDSRTGIITGTIKEKGRYPVTFRARSAAGLCQADFEFVAEGQLSLTPSLGWNSWNAYGRNVTDALARRAADAMVSMGLIDHGWTYINLDDGWERSPREGDALNEGPARDADGNFIPNKKFPDMKALGEYIHSKGLKFGIYSSPGPTTCQGLEASLGHEEHDVMQWCSWGVDYLKYDWCSYRAQAPGLAGLKKPYQVMRAALNQAPRDIVFSMCQYGNGNVWEWGAEPDIAGNSWRTTGDIRDNWPSVAAIGFNPGPRGTNLDLSKYAAPGHWNDPDMLVVGVVGWTFGPQRESNLSPAEQYTHITLWALYPSPMILGCDLAQADDFTVGLLCNDEVLAVHQDLMGKGARAVYKSADGMKQVWSREIIGGAHAVGLFNLEEVPVKVTAKWEDLGISGPQTVRDLWRQKNLGTFDREFSGEIPRHGCLLLKLVAAKAAGNPINR